MNETEQNSVEGIPEPINVPEPRLHSSSSSYSNWQRLITESRSVRWAELLALLLLVVLADVTLYQSQGYSGPALYFLLVPVGIGIGAIQRNWNWQTFLVVLLLWIAAVRLAWCGNWLAVVCGIILTGCFSFSLAGGSLYVLEVIRFWGGLWYSSLCGLLVYENWLRTGVSRWVRIPAFVRMLQLVLPPAMGLVFAVIFVLANPDLASWMTHEISMLVKTVNDWLARVVESPRRVLFWLAAGWVSISLLRPLLLAIPSPAVPLESSSATTADNELYPAFRDTLRLLIVLFAGYLCFEFWTMWKGDFPPHFYYAGYAHEGAFWLTVALGLATVLLSLFFRGRMWTDSRLPRLRRLAMIWSLENLLLALAVFNRLFIYIHFNGMTRMRVVGILGTATVVVGLLLVMLKIYRQQNFAWVIRHQLVALAITIFLYGVLPVDAYVMSYNVQQTLRGNLKPSVQIAHHPTSLEGKLMLFPLLHCEDPIVRNGILALLQQTDRELPAVWGDWTLWQGATAAFKSQATAIGLETFPSPDAEAWQRFRDYSFQWY